MPRRPTVRARIDHAGVNIIDVNGDVLARITNQDAIDLTLSLAQRLRRIHRGARLDAGIPEPRKR